MRGMAPRKPTSLADLDAAFEGALVRRDGFSPQAVEDFYTFLKEAQFVIDRRIINPDKFFWLDPLYKITRSDLFGVKSETGHWLQRPRFEHGVVMRKASQMGASVWSIVFMLWLCIDLSRPLGIGCFWPNEKELQNFIMTRLDPLLASSEKMKGYMEDTKVDNTNAKQIGLSTIYFRYISGNSGADSIAVDVVIGDEIRLWGPAAGDVVQRIKERYKQSDLKLLVLMSTVGSKGDFMEQMWDKSTRMKYFSLCPESDCHTELSGDISAPDKLLMGHALDQANPEKRLVRGVVISDFMPDQLVREDDGRDAHYRCPCCGGNIPDPGAGGYTETNPTDMGMCGIEFATTLATAAVPPAVMLKEFREAKDMKQFMNGYFAKPWFDPEGRPVKPEHWEKSRDASIFWLEHDFTGRNFAGFDLRAREVHYVIGQLPEPSESSGRLLRVGVFQGDGWQQFIRSCMNAFSIEKAICDYAPFWTDTLALADEFEGRMMLAQYRNGEMLRTMASENGKAKRKVSYDAREKHMALLDQTKSLWWSLASFASLQWRVPAQPMWQLNYVDRAKQVHPSFDVADGLDGVNREGFRKHLMGLTLLTKDVTTKNNSGEVVGEAGGETQAMVDADGFDPHWAHAFNYMVMATKLDGGGMSVLRSPRGTASSLGAGGALPVPQANLRVPKRVCGDCLFYREEENFCAAHHWEADPGDPECGGNIWRAAERFRVTS